MKSDPVPGYVYALINYSMPGLVKIGRTTRTPVERIAELSAATGVPQPFELVFDIVVPDCEAAERLLHTLLSDRGYRLTESREFFQAPIREVVSAMFVVREMMPPVSLALQASERASEDVPQHSDLWTPERSTVDPLTRPAAELCIRSGEGSTSILQRQFRIGYGRAARIIDHLQLLGVLSAPDGENPRRVLITGRELDEILPSAESDPPRS